MVMQTYAINRYKVSLVSHGPSDPDPSIASIQLYEGTPSALTWRGAAFFYPDGVQLPPAVVTMTKIVLFYHAAQLGAVLQLLREESPLWLNGDRQGETAYLSTSEEPVGEEEGSAG